MKLTSLAKAASAASGALTTNTSAAVAGVIKDQTGIHRLAPNALKTALGATFIRGLGIEKTLDFIDQMKRDYKTRLKDDDKTQKTAEKTEKNTDKLVKQTETQTDKLVKKSDETKNILEQILDRSTDTAQNVTKLVDLASKRLVKRSTTGLEEIEKMREAPKFDPNVIPAMGTAANSNKKNDDPLNIFHVIAGAFTAQSLMALLKRLVIVPLGAAFSVAMSGLGKALVAAVRLMFNPALVIKLLTKFALPLAIVGALISGIMSGFDEFKKTGDLGKAIVAGLGGAVEFLTFGLIKSEDVQAGIDVVVEKFNEYVIKPIQDILDFVFEGLAQIEKLAKNGLADLVDWLADGMTAMGGGELGFVKDMRRFSSALRGNPMPMGNGPSDRGHFARQKSTVRGAFDAIMDADRAQGMLPDPDNAIRLVAEQLGMTEEKVRKLVGKKALYGSPDKIEAPAQKGTVIERDLSPALEKIVLPQDSPVITRDLHEALPFIQKIAEDLPVFQSDLAELMPNFKRGGVSEEDLLEIISRPYADGKVIEQDLNDIIQRPYTKGPVFEEELAKAPPFPFKVTIDWSKSIDETKKSLQEQFDELVPVPKPGQSLRPEKGGQSQGNPLIINNFNNNNQGGGQSQANPDIYRHKPADSTARYSSKWEEFSGI